MLDVATLQQFDLFSNFNLYAGSKGIYRTISNVVVLDHEGFEDSYTDFHEGDFVITNLFYAKDNPDLIYTSFSKLFQIGVSSIAIKSIYFDQLPEEVIKLAEEKDIPIFFFHSIYIEDVIMSIIDHLRSSTNNSFYENLIDSFLHNNFNDTSFNRLLTDCVKEKHHFVTAIYLTYIRNIDEVTIQRNLYKILHRKNLLSNQDDLFCLKYKKGFLFLYFYKEKPLLQRMMQDWDHIIYDLQINRADYHIGYSDVILPIKKTDIAIQRCIYANQHAVKTGISDIKSSELGLTNLILPLLESRYANEYLMDVYESLKLCETQHSNHLFETLIAYTKCNFSIEKTGKMLYQHPNTIRYRLSKIKTILHCKDEFQFQVIASLITTRYSDN